MEFAIKMVWDDKEYMSVLIKIDSGVQKATGSDLKTRRTEIA
jgi:hypothetical protein